MPAQGTLSLHIGDRQGRRGRRSGPSPGSSRSAAEGSNVGTRRAPSRSPTTTRGKRPWPFVGGTIKRVVIDVSGEAFVDLAMEARAAFARQ